MTLHEVIIELIIQSKKVGLSASEIAEKLNQTRLYTKKDKSIITSKQINARVRRYPHLLKRDKGNIILSDSVKLSSVRNVLKPSINIDEQVFNNKTSLEKDLLSNFQNPLLLNEKSIPDKPGIYCIKLLDKNSIPNLAQELSTKSNDILYIGLASQSLRKRFWNQELRAKGHGTFFRSIGATLGFFPPKGSLINKSNKNNYKFSKEDCLKIIEWINLNTSVSWIEVEAGSDLECIETALIQKHTPIFNLAKNPIPCQGIKKLRKQCKDIANKE